MLKESNDNAIFTTEQCNNHCLMCCQPPKRVDDIERLMQNNLKIVSQMPTDTPVVCITGGEPTLLGDRLFSLIDHIRALLPETAIHILSNGRNFQHIAYVKQLKKHAGNNVFVGVPLHSDYGRDHDKIAGAKNAYSETINGLYNLASEDIGIELRIVVNRLNFNRLPQIASFIYKNLPFVSWIAFMAMEDCGLAQKNRDLIWVEPKDYIRQLSDAIGFLSSSGMEVAIYNIPLCLLPLSMHEYAAQSISDWKVKFLEQCTECAVIGNCCGLFATSMSVFNEIHPLKLVNHE